MATSKQKKGGTKKSNKKVQENSAKPKSRGKKSDKASEQNVAPIAARPRAPGEKPRMLIHFREKVVPEMIKKFSLKNALQVPVFEKIVVNMGIGESVNEQSGFTDNPLRAMTASVFSATVHTLKAGGSICRLATEKTSKGPQKSRTSASSKRRIARLRVAVMFATYHSSTSAFPAKNTSTLRSSITS